MSTNRGALYGKIHKVLKKHYKPVSPPSERTVLDHLLYACCLENARHETADEAFAKLQLYADWNEVRVTTVTELSEVMNMLPDAADAARRLKQTLQSVFETRYSYDLEHLKKLNLGKAIKELEGIAGLTPFVLAYAAQHGLGGHMIPANKGVFNALVAVGVISESDAAANRLPGLERAIPKSKGAEFASLLHQLGVDVETTSQSAKVKAILHEMNPQSAVPKRGKAEAPRRRRKTRSESANAESAAGESPSAEPAKKASRQSPSPDGADATARSASKSEKQDKQEKNKVEKARPPKAEKSEKGEKPAKSKPVKAATKPLTKKKPK